MRPIVRDNVGRVIPLLAAAIAAPIVAELADLPTWARVGAAGGALVAVVLVAVWLPLPWSAWRANRSRRLVAVGLPLAVAAGFVSLGFAVTSDTARHDPGSPAMLVLLDASEGMASGLTDDAVATKLGLATGAVRQHVVDNQFEQVGLASFGDSCASDEPLHEHVGIAFDRKDSIEGELAGLMAGGERNLVAAASNALSLLNPFNEAKWRRLVIVTGGLDGCSRRLDELIDAARGRDVDLAWDVVGLDFAEDEKQRAAALEGEGVSIHLADTPAELDAALASVLGESPIRNGLDEIRQYVTSDVRDVLQEADDALDDRDLDVVEDRLDRAEALVDSAEDRFLTIDTSGQNAVFAPMVELLRQMVDLQREDIDLLGQRLRFARANDLERLDEGDREEWRVLAERNSDVVEQYNEKLRELEPVFEEILKVLFDETRAAG